MLLKANTAWILGIIIVISVFLCQPVSAAWQGPSAEPPNNNVPAPLNVSTIFNGDVTGVYDNLRIKIANCEANQLLYWNGDNVQCEDLDAQINLLEVLNAGSDAGEFSGGVIIGSTTAAWLNLGGALTAGWLHAASDSGFSSFAGTVSIGASRDYKPNDSASLHVWGLDKNAEIDLQSVSGDNNHWAIFHDKTFNDLRFWNKNTDNLMVLGSDKIVSIHGGLQLTDFLPVNKTAKLYNSNGVLYWNGGRIGMGIYVGKSTAVKNGNVGSYSAANALCDATYSGSRVCFNFEMVNSITSGVEALKDETGTGWVMTGAVGNIFGAANDCKAFQSSDKQDFGTVWYFDEGEWGSGYVMRCDNPNNFACCK